MMRWVLVGAVIAMAPARASAECLEVGWRDAGGNFTFYGASVTEMNEAEGRVRLRYDFKGGELDLKIREKETPSGRELIVLRGRWYERGGRSGRVRLEMEKGRHRAKGWYTFGEDDSGQHYDFVLRECRNAPPPPPPPPRWAAGERISVLWKGQWFNARILTIGEARFRIHYDGYGSEWDEWVTEARMRKR